MADSPPSPTAQAQGTSAGAGAAQTTKKPAKRGRKQDNSLPPSRARDVQRAFRARRAEKITFLEKRVSLLEQEAVELRQLLSQHGVEHHHIKTSETWASYLSGRGPSILPPGADPDASPDQLKSPASTTVHTPDDSFPVTPDTTDLLQPPTLHSPISALEHQHLQQQQHQQQHQQQQQQQQNQHHSFFDDSFLPDLDDVKPRHWPPIDEQPPTPSSSSGVLDFAVALSHRPLSAQLPLPHQLAEEYDPNFPSPESSMLLSSMSVGTPASTVSSGAASYWATATNPTSASSAASLVLPSPTGSTDLQQQQQQPGSAPTSSSSLAAPHPSTPSTSGPPLSLPLPTHLPLPSPIPTPSSSTLSPQPAPSIEDQNHFLITSCGITPDELAHTTEFQVFCAGLMRALFLTGLGRSGRMSKPSPTDRAEGADESLLIPSTTNTTNSPNQNNHNNNNNNNNSALFEDSPITRPIRPGFIPSRLAWEILSPFSPQIKPHVLAGFVIQASGGPGDGSGHQGVRCEPGYGLIVAELAVLNCKTAILAATVGVDNARQQFEEQQLALMARSGYEQQQQQQRPQHQSNSFAGFPLGPGIGGSAAGSPL
ncbi:hypothetical protein T439DRAFT_324330 [Meredithblackwellia eburnea MCA 4105]